jgi:hypothetical protein
VIQFYRGLLNEFNQQFNHGADKEIKLLPAEWNVESGELTPDEFQKKNRAGKI